MNIGGGALSNNQGGFLPNSTADEEALNQILNNSEISLEDPIDQKAMKEGMKEYETKLHNSFTGPYPLDPTEFGHMDKGESYFKIFNSIK